MYGDQPQPQPGAYGEPYSTRPKNGLAVVALVFGIVALLVCWIPVVGLVLAVVGLILGIVGLRRARKGLATNRGVALGAVVVGVVATVASLVATVLIGWFAYTAWNNGGAEYANCAAQAGQNEAALEQCEQQYGNEILDFFGVDPAEVNQTT